MKLLFQVAMRALGFEPKKEEIKKMIAEIDKDGTGMYFNALTDNKKFIVVFLLETYKNTCYDQPLG